LLSLSHFHAYFFIFPDKTGMRRFFFLTPILDLIRLFFLWGKILTPATMRASCAARISPQSGLSGESVPAVAPNASACPISWVSAEKAYLASHSFFCSSQAEEFLHDRATILSASR
jgi:hypothetical protein